MSLAQFFGFGGGGSTPIDELPDIFPLEILKKDFIRGDVISIYEKILTDVIERTHGLDDKIQQVLWDNCLQSEANHGLISHLAHAMADRQILFLVYDKATSVLRRATANEEAKIRADYEKSAGSSTGIFISFQKYYRTDFVRIYSALEYVTIGSLNKAMNLSKAIQFKLSDIRATVSTIDVQDMKKQGIAIATAVANGKDILIDAKDIIETAKADLTAADSASDFINQKRAFYLGLPASYICGDNDTGLGDTGESDTKATERGLKNYYMAIIKPVIEAMFAGTKTQYKSQDFRQIEQGLNALKIFELCDNSLISASNKKKVIEGLFDIDEDDNQDTEQPDPALDAGLNTPEANIAPVNPKAVQ